jgi:hypothetical protein
MKEAERGYFFALTRLLARLAGRRVRKAEFSRWEIYSAGWFVFGFAGVVTGWILLPLVRPTELKILVLLLLPAGVWIALLLFYFVNWTTAAILRQLGLYAERTNNPLQHLIIMAVFSCFALALLRDENMLLNSLGIFWLGLVSLELLALLILRFLDEK